MTAYYNEIDPYAAEWLRNLIASGHIAPGVVDERSIADVQPADLAGFRQVHFFAGIGGWSLALRLAGWPDDRPVWTGSCPCQPFSVAGKKRAESDERHLWPDMRRLVAECRPSVVFGEQVASRLGREWLAGVRTDLEALGYAVGAADLCAAGVGAPHIRQRLWWVADAHGGNAGAERQQCGGQQRQQPQDGRDTGGLEHSTSDGRQQRRPESGGRGAPGGRGPRGMADRIQSGLERHARHGDDRHEPGRLDEEAPRSTAASGVSGDPWRGAIWLPCADGKARRIEPGLEPLANGIPARVGRLRAYGNAIVPQVGAAFVTALCDEFDTARRSVLDSNRADGPHAKRGIR